MDNTVEQLKAELERAEKERDKGLEMWDKGLEMWAKADDKIQELTKQINKGVGDAEI